MLPKECLANPLAIGYTKNKKMIIERVNSHCHLSSDLLAEVIAKLEPPDLPFQKIAFDMGRVVGQNICVQTTSADSIRFARRVHRRGLTRFVTNRKPEDCSTVILVLRAIGPSIFLLITAFVGHSAEPEPWDHYATPQSLGFWRNHALIWGQESIVPGTETQACPW